MQSQLNIFKTELSKELISILEYWSTVTPDTENGGFWGSIDDQNKPLKESSKGLVLNARILWTFSVASQFLNDHTLLSVSDRAYEYIIENFQDKEYGGVYWSVDAKGNKLEGRKQVYGQAFCLYGMSAYYLASGKKEALSFAISLYEHIEKFSYDANEGGYLEAFSESWGPLEDFRLSEKDVNEKKTLNTHLHIVEAYAELYKAWPDPGLKNKMESLLILIDKYFINHHTGHLRLFFDEHWNEKIDLISFGHDIEAAWLLQQCAELTGNANLIKMYTTNAISLTDAAIRGLDADGGIWYEYDIVKHELIKEKHWWPQAESMIGFFNAWQLSGKESYLLHCLNSWNFIKKYLLDTRYGEWYWGVSEDYSIIKAQDKAGFWKCPYHNSRACMELIKRIGHEPA